MSAVKVDEIFDNAFVSITRKLTSIDLEKDVSENDKEDIEYRELVFTKGKFASTIVCEFSKKIFEHIICEMYGNSLPEKDMQILYINEYVNIVCGRAISEINNVTGFSTRLTVPSFHSIDDKIKKIESNKRKISLNYKTCYGVIRVSVYYIFEK